MIRAFYYGAYTVSGSKPGNNLYSQITLFECTNFHVNSYVLMQNRRSTCLANHYNQYSTHVSTAISC